jgi:hypothetical protein
MGTDKKLRAIGFIMAVALVVMPQSLFSLDLSLHLAPMVSVPTMTPKLYSTGGGADVRADLELFGFTDVFVEGGLQLAPFYALTTENVLLGNGGVGFGFYAYPIPRIKLRAAGSAGAYGAYQDTEQSIGWYWKARAEVGYRLSPGVSLLGAATYSSYQTSFSTLTSSLYQGFSFGACVDISLGLFGSSGGGIRLEEKESDPVYPVNYSAYEKLALGKVRITNTEQAELRNVQVSFSVGSYSSEPAPCLSLPYVAKGASFEVPLYASFNPTILGLTENTKMQGEVRIDYELLGAKMESSKAESVNFLHRNALTWKDPAIMGGFVSPNDPAVLDLSKYIAGLVRERIRPDLDKSLQFGMGLFESLRLLGIKYAADPSTPYAVFHKDPAKIDYLQYPYQTLAYKGGDSDDLGVLYAAILESVGLDAALIPMDGEVIVAFRLEMNDTQARTSFITPGDLIYRDGKAWIPVEVSKMREGFLSAWQGGAALWNKASESGKPTFIIVADAWQKYDPVGLPGIDYRSPKPEEAQVNLAFENAMGSFVAREVGPRAQRLLSDMGPSGGTGRQYNSLGILYAKYGLLKEANAAFLKAVTLGYTQANTNLANVAFLQKDYDTAIKYFQAALAIQPDNKTALIGLARAKYEVDAYSDADALYAQVSALDPALASHYAYLSSRVDVTAAARASAAAADRGGATAWDSDK